MAKPAEIIDLILALPPVRFASLSADGTILTLSYESRLMAAIEVAATERSAPWSALNLVNELAHRALFQSGIQALPPGEAVNAAHQLVEWWDAAVFAIGRLPSS